VKSLNETFTTEQFRELKEVKGNRSWRRAILDEFGVESTE